jgi:hypothetical protein
MIEVNSITLKTITAAVNIKKRTESELLFRFVLIKKTIAPVRMKEREEAPTFTPKNKSLIRPEIKRLAGRNLMVE